METKRVVIGELEGAALDWAVAMAIEAWKSAHEFFPTWTLDATFSGVQPMIYSDGESFCQLVPNNPMRQDPQKYSPTTDWSQCGPLIEQHITALNQSGYGWWAHSGNHLGEALSPLIAACRAIVASHNPDGYVEVPVELLNKEEGQ